MSFLGSGDISEAMKPADGATVPIWYQGTTIPNYPEPPNGPVRVDICIVGAGIAGLTSAYLLAKSGKSVIVLDEGSIGSGQTGRTSAHLASAIDDRFVEVEKLHGIDGSKLAHHSHAAAIDMIEQISRVEEIDCEFRRLDAYLFSAPGDSPDLLEKELAAARRAGMVDVELVQTPALKASLDGPAIRFGQQARFHPLKYLAGLAAAAEKLGVGIYTGCRVTAVQGSDAKKQIAAKATIDAGNETTFEAAAIVVATNTPSPINDWMAIYLKQASYRSYVIGLKVPAGSIDDVLYWDTVDPYHYIRLGGDVLLVGGEDHKTGQYPPHANPFLVLENWAREHFPMSGELVTNWSGQIQEPADYLGYAGKAPTAGDDVYVITGDSGMGLTHGTLGAMLINDLIHKRPNPWTTIYDPARLKLDTDLVKENANTLASYADLITGGDVATADAIPAGEGAVIRRGLSKIAVYKSENGKVSECSAICTHLQCVVHWNPAEKSWDCPCHGSRFSPEGKVLMGPAIDDLGSVKPE
jgi:glycine/D-amino acid oxidase-like deaminating enzyme/nitrite reductase/ring-hydroxylating ferredoxin subunit